MTASNPLWLYILTNVLIAIYLSLTIYFTYDYCKYFQHLVLTKRYSYITTLECLCIVIKLSIEFISNTAEMTSTITPHSITYSILFFISQSCFVIWEWLMTYRCWCIYYDISWTGLTMADGWKSILNKKHMDHECPNNRFIIKYRATLGNPKFVLKYIFSILITMSVLWTFLPVLISVLYPDYFTFIIFAELSTLPITILPYFCLIATYLIFRQTLFNDLLYIKSELTKIYVLLPLIAISFWTYIICIAVFDKVNIYLQLASRNGSTFFIFLTISSTTKYVIWKLKHMLKTNDLSYLKQISEIPSQFINEQNTEIKNLTLMKILNNEKFFALFMDHLILEISIECMLSFIELVQFQKHLHNSDITQNYVHSETKDRMSMTDDNNIIEVAMFGNIEFCDYIPESFIVESMKNINIVQYKMCAHQLWKKYIEQGTNLEINLSYRSRQDFNELFSDYINWINKDFNIKQLIELFNDCVDELFMLMDG
eukprot:154353_1